MKKLLALILCTCCLLQTPARAEDIAALSSQVRELTRLVSDLKLVVDAQQKEIAAFKNATLPSSPVLPPARPGVSPMAGRWNPDIGVVVDTVLTLDSPKTDDEGADRISVRELELIVGSAVDPHSRLDATVALSDFEDPSLEEAYYTHFGLPWDFTGRVGKFKPHVGKAITQHRDSLDTVDEPFVIQRYFGVEGYNKAGADLTKTLELPWNATHRMSFGVLEGGNGEDGMLFGETRREPTLYAHLSNFWDLDETTGLEVGGSYLAGSRDDDEAFEVNVFGVDATLIRRYGDRTHVKLQAEGFLASRRESFYALENPDTAEITEEDLDDARHLTGGYLLFDWRFDPQWAAGARLDSVQLVESGEDFAGERSTERGLTGYLTFHQSEFARWRLQVTHAQLTDGEEDNRVFVQGTFAIGEHKHKIV